ncbi:MAG: hypothetical protein J5772_04325 [Clostridia bacterium]|nr:hypothetical protein [Clostridia bacterium]
MDRIEKLLRFIPVLDMEGLGEWVADARAIREGGKPAAAPEYIDAVFRFAEAAEAAEEALPAEPYGADAKKAELIHRIASAVRAEESCPGILIGFLQNGTIVGWLKELEALCDKE